MIRQPSDQGNDNDMVLHRLTFAHKRNHTFKLLILLLTTIVLNVFFLLRFHFPTINITSNDNNGFQMNLENSFILPSEENQALLSSPILSSSLPSSSSSLFLSSDKSNSNKIIEGKNRKIGFVHVGKAGGSTASNMLLHGCVGVSPSLQLLTLKIINATGFKKNKRNIEFLHRRVSNKTINNRHFKSIKKETSLSNIHSQLHLLYNDQIFKDRQTKLCKSTAENRFKVKGVKRRKGKIAKRQSLISQRTFDYFHVRKLKNIQLYDTFIVTIRHPIDRLISWFLFSHTKNRDIKAWRNATHVYNCYNELNDLATFGLSSSSQNDNKTNNNCQQIAYNCIIGNDYLCEHMFFNYEFYIGDILKYHKDKDIFVLRTNTFDEDWERINDLLSNDNTQNNNKNNASTFGKKTYRGKNYTAGVTNKTISAIGLQNVCRVLCDEIQLYKTLLQRAVNLNKFDRLISFNELNDTCPIQTLEGTC